MSPRTCDTVHIFYVRSQQRNAQEIVSNVLSESSVSPHFVEFIHTLGWPVNVSSHPGKKKKTLFFFEVVFLYRFLFTTKSWNVNFYF